MKSLIRPTYYLPAVLLATIIAISCSKNAGNGSNNHTDSTATTVSLIALSSWKYDTSGLDTNGDGIIDVGGDTTVVPLCERDDLYTFNKDYSGSVNTGTKHCVVGEAQTET